jgi:anti-sigma factor RsiW
MKRASAIDRAFALAGSGQHRSVAAILRQLDDDERSEVEAHLATPNARRELILACGDAWLAAR